MYHVPLAFVTALPRYPLFHGMGKIAKIMPLASHDTFYHTFRNL